MIRPHDLALFPLPQIRHATPADIAAIVAIEKESFIDPWEQAVFLEALTYYPTTYFVAECDGAVVGFVVGGLEDTGEN
ncbi:MAG: ribosomal-protein-alanine N-acetyltransferase, partial [Methanoregula sp.]